MLIIKTFLNLSSLCSHISSSLLFVTKKLLSLGSAQLQGLSIYLTLFLESVPHGVYLVFDYFVKLG